MVLHTFGLATTTGECSVSLSPAFPPNLPSAQGLYDPRFEKDACGVAFVATLTGEASHDIVAKALTALRNLEHRGAAGAEANSGDGAGILMQVPDAFLLDVVDWVEVTEGIADGAGALARRYRKSHSGVDIADCVIAATTSACGAELWTRNIKHFPMFPRLTTPD